jgi:hypothetical protein
MATRPSLTSLEEKATFVLRLVDHQIVQTPSNDGRQKIFATVAWRRWLAKYTTSAGGMIIAPP